MTEKSGSARANPYIGPRPFREDETKLFFARQREIRILKSMVLSKRAVLLFAQSGAGKTSLINAGLIPSLKKQEQTSITRGRKHRVRTIQQSLRVLPVATVGGVQASTLDEGDNPFVVALLSSLSPEADVSTFANQSLEDGLASHLGIPPEPKTEEEGPSGADSEPTLLVIDQFEQLFTLYPERFQQRREFFSQLGKAMEEWPQLRLLLAMREDFIAELTPFAALLPHQLRDRFRLERLAQMALSKRSKVRLNNSEFHLRKVSLNLWSKDSERCARKQRGRNLNHQSLLLMSSLFICSSFVDDCGHSFRATEKQSETMTSRPSAMWIRRSPIFTKMH